MSVDRSDHDFATRGSEDSDGEPDLVDQHGIPMTVKHSPQNQFTAVWQYIHRLHEERQNPRDPQRPFTHICVVCAEDLKGKDTTSTAWLTCLQRQKTSSNAQKHMIRQHEGHPYSIGATKALKEKKMAKIQAHKPKLSEHLSSEQKSKRQRTIEETSMITEDEMRILSTRWLLSSGLPYTALENPELLYLVRRLSNRPELTFPARETFYGYVAADFQSFVNLTSVFLRTEFTKVHGLPFVSLIHDMWTNGSNVNVIGVTIILISSQWNLINFSLLAAPSLNGHAAKVVATTMKEKIKTRYDIDIESLTRFTVSDTTCSARNVSDHFENTDQVDCLMHQLSLCLLYALGLKENTRKDGTLIITPGGKFDEGLRIINLLRNLATFFGPPARETKLKQIKNLYNLPCVNISIDAKTRVEYAVTLMRRTIYNFYAFSKYFETAPVKEQAMWCEITSDDWSLIIEMEAITNELAAFSLGEVQKKSVSSSFALLFRKLLRMTMEKSCFPCLVLERPDPLSSEFTQRRELKDIKTFSAEGKKCLARLKHQWELRFPEQDENEIKAMLLDPRIKSKATLIVDDVDLLARVEKELELEHEAIYMKLATSATGNSTSKMSEKTTTTGQEWFHLERATSEAVRSLLDVEIPASQTSEGANVRMEAAKVLSKWKELSVSWPCSSTDGKYSIMQLYRTIDILKWYKEHGEREFPTIAVLARIYLGKPMSTAIQERFFSLGKYIVNDLRTSLDDERAEMACLMKANWQEYKTMLQQ